MHQRREVDELDRDARDDRCLAPGWAREVDEQGPQSLTACRERLAADLGDDAPVQADGVVEPVLELGEIRLEARRFTQLGERAHLAAAVCSATIPPAKVR